MAISVGDEFPFPVFKTIPYSEANSGIKACGVPVDYDSSKEWKGRRVVLFSVPGAFTPGCQGQHLPSYVTQYDELKKKGVDIIAVISSNDSWVLSAWLKANGCADKILGLSDPNAEFSKKIGWSKDLTSAGLGIRTCRYAIVVGCDGKVEYAKLEPESGVTVSGADAVLASL